MRDVDVAPTSEPSLLRLPDFVIIGTMKGGTTALTRGLRNHPNVFIAPGKEVHYFDEHYERGIDWYAEKFSMAAEDQVIGEATPRYMDDQAVAGRMVGALPKARFVAILRNPTDRAYSHYWHNRYRNRETKAFEEVIGDGCNTSEPYGYIEMGRYLDQLRYLEKQVGAARILVVLNEDLRFDRAATLGKVWTYIGTDPDKGDPDQTLPKSLKGRVKQRRRDRRSQYPPLHPDTRKFLTSFYREEVAALESWLGRDLSAWRT